MKKLFEEGILSGNGTGQGGGSSLPFNKGFYTYGNTGEPGITFTPTGEEKLKTYKGLKHSKKEMKKRKMKKFKEFIKEDATATAGNTGGMGAVSAATPSATPGDVAGSISGSGDIGTTLGTFSKKPANIYKNKNKKKKKKNKKIKNFENFDQEIDNFTARYYDNYDDEDMSKYRNDINEDLVDYYTFECSGSPSPYFKTKADFFNFMENNGFKHSTLTKKTDMLIVADKNQNTLKYKKAERYGVPVYTYREAKVKVKEMGKKMNKYNL